LNYTRTVYSQPLKDRSSQILAYAF